MRILFEGDSITDVGKNADAGSLLPIGQGYPVLPDAYLSAEFPQKYTFKNVGISGRTPAGHRLIADAWLCLFDAEIRK